MKNKDLKRLQAGLINVGDLKAKDSKIAKFSYGIAKNKKVVDREIETITETLDKIDGYKKFKEERDVIYKELGRANQFGGMTVPEDKMEEFNQRIEALKTKYKKALDETEKTEKELNEVENKVELHKIKLEDVPSDITPSQMEGISEIVEE